MKPVRWTAAFDVHGDMQDTAAVGEFLRFNKSYKPDIRISGGDIHDFRWLRKKAGEEERAQDITADFEAGNQFLADYMPTVFIEGNHDFRLSEAAKTTVIGSHRKFFRDLLDERDEVIKGAKFIPYDKRLGVYKLGKLAVIHGFTEGLYAARKAAQSYGNVLMGHIHALYTERLPTWPLPAHAYASGCLAKVDLGYNNRSLGTLREQNGFAYGLVWPSTGKFTVNLAYRENTNWFYPGMA